MLRICVCQNMQKKNRRTVGRKQTSSIISTPSQKLITTPKAYNKTKQEKKHSTTNQSGKKPGKAAGGRMHLLFLFCKQKSTLKSNYHSINHQIQKQQNRRRPARPMSPKQGANRYQERYVTEPVPETFAEPLPGTLTEPVPETIAEPVPGTFAAPNVKHQPSRPVPPPTKNSTTSNRVIRRFMMEAVNVPGGRIAAGPLQTKNSLGQLTPATAGTAAAAAAAAATRLLPLA